MSMQELLPYIEFFKGFANPYWGVLIAGLFYGMTFCSLSCLPYLGTYIMGMQQGFGKGLKAAFIFSLSRIVTYTFLGGLCGYIGSLICEEINPRLILFITGLILFLIGIIVILSPLRSCIQNGRSISKKISVQNAYLHLIIMGIVISLTPCPPLTGILLYSSTTHSVFTGGFIAFMFSIGTSISPLCLFGGAAGWFSQKISLRIPQHRRFMQRISGIILALLGARLLYGVFYI